MELAQILPDGGISAGYILAGVMSVAMFLFWNTISGMRADLREIKKDVDELKSNDRARTLRIEHIETQAQNSSRANKDLLDEINDKIDLIRSMKGI